MKKKGIFCIEGEWEKDLSDQASVRPLVEFLANSDSMASPIYRRAATRESFSYFVSRWRQHTNYTIGYFPFHGVRGALRLGKELLTLDELGSLLADSCSGRHVVLSSCETLNVSHQTLEAFRKKTGARSVSGYRKKPDWIESSAFDVMLMTNLVYHDSPAKTEKWLEDNCAGLIKRYGFVMNYRTRSV